MGFIVSVIAVAVILLEGRVIAGAGVLDLFREDPGAREDLVKWAGYGDEKLSTVVISGKLLCHGNGAKERTAIHPYPVSGATVAVMCSRTVKTKKSWAKTTTDSHGEFTMDVPSNLHAVPNLEKTCHVKVVHLPRSSPCRHACTRHLKRIELTSIGEGVRTYTAHNIHLMPPKHAQN